MTDRFARPDAQQSRETQLKILRGLFEYRDSLKNQDQIAERALVDEALGQWLYARSERRGIDEAIGESYLSGIISNRADALDLLSPVIRAIDDREHRKDRQFPIIGIVGRIASGKGTVGEILSSTYDSFHLPFSDRLREFAQAVGNEPPFSRSALREVDGELKPKFGKQVFVDWTLKAAERLAANLHEPQLVSVDGFRSLEEAQWFLQQPNTILVAIQAHPDLQEDIRLRYKRSIERRRAGEDPLIMEGFLANDEKERAWIDPIMKLASKTFYNGGSKEELKGQVLEHFKQLIA